MMDSCHGSRRSSPPIQFLSAGPPPSPANKLCPNRPAIALMQLAAISPSRCLLLAAAGVDRYSHRIDQVGRPLACLHSCRPGPARPCMMHVVSMHFSSESTHLSMTPPCACVLMLSIVDPKFPTRISIAKRRKREVKNTCRRARTYVLYHLYQRWTSHTFSCPYEFLSIYSFVHMLLQQQQKHVRYDRQVV